MLEPVLSVLILILAGVAIKKYEILPPEFFSHAEKFSGNIAFPALIFTGTATLPFMWTQMADLAITTLCATFAVFGITLVVLRLWTCLPKQGRASVVQGAIRPNSYLGITVASLFFAPNTAALLMLALAICLPVVNVIAVVVLSWWGTERTTLRAILKSVALHPVIVATTAGLAVSILGIKIPGMLMGSLGILGKSSLALGLLCVGGGLMLSKNGLQITALTVTAFLKMLLLPAIAAVACKFFGVSGPMATIACFYCALPTAPNAYLLTKQMGGDARLMASLITTQTLLAPLSLPFSQHLLDWLN